MKLRLHLIAFCCFCLLVAGAQASAPNALTISNVILYQPNEVATDRLSDVRGLAGYIHELMAGLNQEFANAGRNIPRNLDLVVIVKPEKKVKFWFVGSLPGKKPDNEKRLRDALSKIDPPDVTNGAFAFAIETEPANQKRTVQPGYLPLPDEWKNAVKKTGRADLIIPDGIMPYIWAE